LELRTATGSIRHLCYSTSPWGNRHQDVVDEKISRYTANYELKRISAVDRNILRLAVYEMLFSEDVPPVVAINEQLISPRSSAPKESGKFVNGVFGSGETRSQSTAPHCSERKQII